MSLASTAYTLRAPAWAAKKARIPLPVPTSRTIFPCKDDVFTRKFSLVNHQIFFQIFQELTYEGFRPKLTPSSRDEGRARRRFRSYYGNELVLLGGESKYYLRCCCQSPRHATTSKGTEEDRQSKVSIDRAKLLASSTSREPQPGGRMPSN